MKLSKSIARIVGLSGMLALAWIFQTHADGAPGYRGVIAIPAIPDAPPSKEYSSFVSKFESAERVDVFYFFNDPFDFKDKVVILDVRFDQMNSPDEAAFTVWRNFGKLRLIVSDIPEGEFIPQDKPILIAGIVTGFKNEVVSGALVTKPTIRFMGKYVCNDARCIN